MSETASILFDKYEKEMAEDISNSYGIVDQYEKEIVEEISNGSEIVVKNVNECLTLILQSTIFYAENLEKVFKSKLSSLKKLVLNHHTDLQPNETTKKNDQNVMKTLKDSEQIASINENDLTTSNLRQEFIGEPNECPKKNNQNVMKTLKVREQIIKIDENDLTTSNLKQEFIGEPNECPKKNDLCYICVEWSILDYMIPYK